MRIWSVKKSALVTAKIDTAPYAIAAHKDRGDSFLIREDHPDFRQLYDRARKATSPKGIKPSRRSRMADVRRLRRFRRLWRQLHLTAIKCASCDRKSCKFRPWVKNIFPARLPCGECREDFFRLLRENPPPEDQSQLFAWTVHLHDCVNQKLGKPIFGIDAASALYTQCKSNIFAAAKALA